MTGRVENTSLIDSRPTEWDEADFHRNLDRFLRSLAENGEGTIPLGRIQFQMGQDSIYRDVSARWSAMTGTQRLTAWKSLLRAGEELLHEVLPVCVQCGDCCRKGSPTLQLEDLDLLRDNRIRSDQLFTLRHGEPVSSPFKDRVFPLEGERIKLRERPETRECIFFSDETDSCTIYADRPVQCRAQACWDPGPAMEAAKQPFLTRRDIFEGVDILLEIMAEHDRRCPFSGLNDVFTRLAETKGENIEEVLRLLAFENHFRDFISSKLDIPAGSLDLILGRSFACLVQLFGFKIVIDTEGNHCLVPDVPDENDSLP